MPAAANGRPRSGALRLPAVGAATLVLAARVLGQEGEPSSELPAERAGRQTDDPGNALELYVGDDALGLGYRSSFHRGNGYTTLGYFMNQDDDYSMHGRYLRFGEPSSETPLALGVGIGGFVAVLDESDAEVAAITLTGAVEYELRLDLPVRLGLEASYAPDVATFVDGRRVVDLQARVEADLSNWATFFAGYRHLEVDLGDEDDELDNALHVGVRLGSVGSAFHALLSWLRPLEAWGLSSGV